MIMELKDPWLHWLEHFKDRPKLFSVPTRGPGKIEIQKTVVAFCADTRVKRGEFYLNDRPHANHIDISVIVSSYEQF